MENLNALASFKGIALMKNKTEVAYYLDRADTTKATVFYWRGRFSVSSVDEFIDRVRKQRLNFQPA